MPLPLGAEPPLPPVGLSCSLNGTDNEALERFKIRELMEGFAAHRDASEWRKLRDMFAEQDAYVWTTWSGGVPIDEFIKISAEGFVKGARIMHRVAGGTVDLAISGPAAGKRALGKLKMTITQRFTLPCEAGGDCDVDVDADFRACYFLEKNAQGEWKNHFYKGIYEKDKLVPVDPRRIPKVDDERLKTFPVGYKHLAYCQSFTYKIKMDLAGLRGQEHDDFYYAFTKWLEGTPMEQMKEMVGVGKY